MLVVNVLAGTANLVDEGLQVVHPEQLDAVFIEDPPHP
jgi:hypothetical protein